jgi:hypothetical protein
VNALVKRLTSLLVLAGVGLVLPNSCQAQVRALEVDFSKVIGTIRPLNGVNGGPIVTRGAFDLSDNFRELGIKHIRLHDIPWEYENVVDINYVFPRFEADADDPANYDFFLTDYYLKSIRSIGAEVTYRLGYSAEWPYHPPIHNKPPKDFEKWAHVCVNIVKHYKGGWDQGLHDQIKYWEVWNEPDGWGFWASTLEEYYKLYRITATAIKHYDPSLKVGGPALAGDMKFLEGFLKYCQAHGVPVDFVSWHRYDAKPYQVLEMSQKVRALMTQYGFGKAESVLNEWNYFPGDWGRQENEAQYRKKLFTDEMGGSLGAAYDASVFIYLQDSSVDLADFFQGTAGFWGGLYDAFGVPRKPYYSFKAFKFCLRTPRRVATSGSDRDGLAVLAGLSDDKSEATILISNFGTQIGCCNLSLRAVPWKGPTAYEKYVIDNHHDLDLIKSAGFRPGTLTVSENVEAPSVCMIRLKAGTNK